MPNYIKIHGLTLAAGSSIQNAVVESLTSDPSPTYPGQMWFNTTTKQFKYSGLTALGAIQINVFGSAQEMTTFIESISSSAGTSLVGYDGQAGANDLFSLTASAADVALDSLVLGLDAEIKARIDAITTLSNSLTDLTGDLQTELDASQAAAGLSSTGTYVPNTGTNYIDAATTLAGADVLLDTQLKATDVIAQAALPVTGGTMTGDIQLGNNEIFTSATPSSAGALVNKAYADSIAAGFDPKASVRVATTGPITLEDVQTVDGIVLVAGDRVLVKDQVDATLNGIYDVVEGGVWVRSADFDGTPVAEISGGANTYVEVGTENEGAGFVVLHDGIVALGTDDIIWTQTSGTGAVAGIQAEIDTIESNVGLDTDGTYSVSGTNYIDAASTLKAADVLLDTQLKTTTDGLATEVTARGNADTAIQNELDATQTGAGLSAAGAYVANVGSNYIDGAATLAAADVLLDTQLKTVADLVGTNGTAIQNELDATQTGAGLSAAGAYVANVGSNYIDSATSLAGADVLLDGQVKTVSDALATEINDRGTAISTEITNRSNADTAIQNELDATQAGSGLSTAGAYVPNLGTDYIGAATSLANADVLLDTALKAVVDLVASNTLAFQGEIDTTQAGAGLSATGAYVANSGTNYIDSATTLAGADVLLDTQVKVVADGLATEITNRGNADTSIQNELNTTQTGAGLSATGEYVANTGSNYIDTAASLAAADVLLDTQLKATDVIAQAALPVAGGTMTGDIQLGANEIFTSAIPSSAGALVNKAYADSIAAGFDPKASVRVATTGPITLEDVQTVDGILLVAGDRVLVKNQVNATLNGIYDVVEGGAWVRSHDFDGTPAAEISGGANTYAEVGTENEGAGFVLLHDGIVDLGVDGIIWTQTSGTGAVAGIQAEIDTIESSVGLEANGTYSLSGTNYLDTAPTLKAADVLLDTQLKTTTDAVAAAQSELNVTQAGAGLSVTGAYVANSGTNYIDAATTFASADVLLDTQVKVVADALATEVTARGTAVSAVRDDYNALIYTIETVSAASTHVITHNLNSAFVDVIVWVKNALGVFQNDIVLITETSTNVLTIDCTEAVNVKVIVRSSAAL